jgi:hypothetical protein
MTVRGTLARREIESTVDLVVEGGGGWDSGRAQAVEDDSR